MGNGALSVFKSSIIAEDTSAGKIGPTAAFVVWSLLILRSPVLSQPLVAWASRACKSQHISAFREARLVEADRESWCGGKKSVVVGRQPASNEAIPRDADSGIDAERERVENRN